MYHIYPQKFFYLQTSHFSNLTVKKNYVLLLFILLIIATIEHLFFRVLQFGFSLSAMSNSFCNPWTAA